MKKFLMTLAIMTLLGSAAMAQDVWKMVESQRFRFIAYRINSTLTQEDPRFATLNELGYGLEITKKWVQCKLPFVGKVYRHAMNDQHIEINANAKEYTYEYKKVKRRKTTGIEVKISARSSDNSDKFDLIMDIDEKGFATMTIRSNSRETVTYYGKILPVGLPEK